MNTPTPFQLAMIAMHSTRKTPTERAEAALELWDECESLIYNRKQREEEQSIINEQLTEQERSEEGRQPREPERLSVDDFLRKFHPRKKTKTMPKMRKDFESWLAWLFYMVDNSYPRSEVCPDDWCVECPENCPIYGICERRKVKLDIDGGFKARLGGDFIWWYNRENSLKKSRNGRKGVVAKRLKHVQKTVK